jgi:hypothetical protein
MPYVVHERVTGFKSQMKWRCSAANSSYFLLDETAHLVARTFTSRSGST